MWPSCKDGGHLARLRLINLSGRQGSYCHSEEKIKDKRNCHCEEEKRFFNFYVSQQKTKIVFIKKKTPKNKMKQWPRLCFTHLICTWIFINFHPPTQFLCIFIHVYPISLVSTTNFTVSSISYNFSLLFNFFPIHLILLE